MKTPNTDQLIAALAIAAKPAAPAHSAFWVWMVGFGMALAASFTMAAAIGLRSDIQAKLAQPGFLAIVLLMLVSAGFWGWAAARLAAPRWPLAWDVIASITAGLVAWGFMMVPDMLASDTASVIETLHDASTHECAMVVTFMTLPATWAFLAASRHAMPSSPHMMMAAATASGASFSMLAITLLCANENPSHLVVGHMIPALLLAFAASLIGRRFLRW